VVLPGPVELHIGATRDVARMLPWRCPRHQFLNWENAATFKDGVLPHTRTRMPRPVDQGHRGSRTGRRAVPAGGHGAGRVCRPGSPGRHVAVSEPEACLGVEQDQGHGDHDRQPSRPSEQAGDFIVAVDPPEESPEPSRTWARPRSVRHRRFSLFRAGNGRASAEGPPLVGRLAGPLPLPSSRVGACTGWGT
jgi:hypothetical protein